MQWTIDVATANVIIINLQAPHIIFLRLFSRNFDNLKPATGIHPQNIFRCALLRWKTNGPVFALLGFLVAQVFSFVDELSLCSASVWLTRVYVCVVFCSPDLPKGAMGRVTDGAVADNTWFESGKFLHKV